MKNLEEVLKVFAEELVKAASFGQSLDRERLLSLAKRAGIDQNLKRFLSKFNI